MVVDILDSVDFSNIKSANELFALDRVCKRIRSAKAEVKKEALIQRTDLYSAFDEVDWQWAATFSNHPRKDLEMN